MSNNLMVIYALLGGWSVFSIYYIVRVFTKGPERVVLYVYDSIPGVFTTLGILGTFIGIYLGLRTFDVGNITESIPQLLEGLKTAFITSIIGIAFSLVFGKVSQVVLRAAEKKNPASHSDELAALQAISKAITVQKEVTEEGFTKLSSALVGEMDSSIATHFVKLRNQFSDTTVEISKQRNALDKINDALGGDGETSLLTQIQLLRAEQKEDSAANKKNIGLIVETMKANSDLIANKFDEFSELLAKNNTEALVEVMEKATEKFNAQMSELINKLVKENFQELNKSVERMNNWQQENKEMISTLTEQFQTVSLDFKIASESIRDITENTSKLTSENSHLQRLITELQEVMINDTKFTNITNQLSEAINTIDGSTKSFDNTTEKLNDWVRNQMNFSDGVAKLMTRLEEIDRIKDINEVFWNNTKKQLDEGVTLVTKANEKLADDVENINAEFYERLNDTMQNLDSLIQRIIENYK